MVFNGVIFTKVMKLMLILLALALSAHAEESPYEAIVERNAFNLSENAPAPVLPPAAEILAPSVFLTGITRLNGVEKIHFVLRKSGDPDKFVSLAANEKQYKIELKKILEYSAYISNNGKLELLSFEKNSLPTIITKKATEKKSSSSRYSRDRRENSKKEEKSPNTTKPNVVTVPSRLGRRSDPRAQQMIEKSLDYVSKIDDPKRRDAILERIEKYQKNEHDSIGR